jgi:hypothetical protein
MAAQYDLRGVCAVHCVNVMEVRVKYKESNYRGADNSLARPGRKQATATEDFEFCVSYV